MRTSWAITRVTSQRVKYQILPSFRSDEDFIRGFPVSRRLLTAEEFDAIRASGDPRVLEPQLMLPPHQEGNEC